MASSFQRTIQLPSGSIHVVPPKCERHPKFNVDDFGNGWKGGWDYSWRGSKKYLNILYSKDWFYFFMKETAFDNQNVSKQNGEGYNLSQEISQMSIWLSVLLKESNVTQSPTWQWKLLLHLTNNECIPPPPSWIFMLSLRNGCQSKCKYLPFKTSWNFDDPDTYGEMDH